MPSLAGRAARKIRRIVLRKTAGIRSSLRSGIVGCGAIAPEHIEGYETSGLAQVVAVCDLSPLALAGVLDYWPYVTAYKDLHQMLSQERLDVVSVCTWPDSHAKIVVEAVAAGAKGIMCEKPFALQLSEVETMLSICAKHGCKLAVGHQYRFHSLFMRAAQIIREGQLGKLINVSGNIASTLANNGPHLIDTIRFLLGDPKPVAVEANCERLHNSWNRGIPAEDGAWGVLTFENGLKCHFETGNRSQTDFSIVVTGANGSLEVTPAVLTVNGHEVLNGRDLADDYRRRQFQQFLEWVEGNRTSYIADAQSSAETAHVLLGLYESARLGQVLQMPVTNKGNIIQQLFPVTATEPSTASISYPKSHSVATLSSRLASEGGSRRLRQWFSAAPSVGISEWLGVSRVILSKKMNAMDGHEVKALEEEFAAAYGVKYAVASTSGTAAIHVALAALDPEPCDEIITTPITDMGSIIPILASNCVPVFADVDPATGNLTAATIEKRITPRTKAVILVHLFGRPAEIHPILELLRPKGIALIEDCAQAHYADYRGKKVGSYGDFGCFSLQQSKQMTCGDGGITLVNRDDLVDRAALFVDKGWNRRQGLRTHLFLGMNYRMTELQAAVARAQLRKLPRMVAQLQATAALLGEELRKIGPVMVPPVIDQNSHPSWWMYPFSIDQRASKIDINELYGELRAEGVRVAREYVPQAVFNYVVLKDQRTYGKSRYPFSAVNYVPPDIRDFPGFLEFKKNLLYIGWSSNITVKDVKRIASAVEKVVRTLTLSANRDSLQESVRQSRPALSRL